MLVGAWVGEIKVVLLDLGNVLLEFSHLPIGEGLSRHAREARFQDPQEVIQYLFRESPAAEDPFDEGRVSAFEFFQEIASHMGLGISFEEFARIWNSIFRERPGAGEVVGFLKKRVGLHLLSNTNPLHFEHCLSQFHWLRDFDSWFLSYELGRKKPNPEVYRAVLDSLGCVPREILYLDDIRENLEPAAAMGINTSWVTPGASLKELLRPWLPQLPWDGP